MQDFKDKIVLVTGGATGIGRAAALAFGRRGALLVLAGRRQSEGDKAVAALAETGASGRFIATDVTQPDDLAKLHQTILRDHGRLDVAFNNTGYQEPRAPLAEQDARLYDRVFDTNVRSVYLSLQHQVRLMAQQGGGAIVVNASVSGLRNPNPGLALYSASKAALVSLTRSAAMEYAEKGIRINAVAPGRVVTDMMLASKIMDMGAVAAGLPLRRMGRPEEVAEAVVWLASDAASFVVGHVLCTDGGFMAL
ncbi:MAG: glucose 1-dehydrogenase [Reyranella sp.]|uniref:SDR family NAD(P)-dependent oxidoreductase n=1 Tax=Reyranella sp. TaxID=1929291 RepID=UPI00122490E5|nr:glucose 1-dehydrogenase [Reyranella sp.]TAJ36776.1 MAG: glucose 1-dehydrogenase [Reyranella sp.]